MNKNLFRQNVYILQDNLLLGLSLSYPTIPARELSLYVFNRAWWDYCLFLTLAVSDDSRTLGTIVRFWLNLSMFRYCFVESISLCLCFDGSFAMTQ